MMADFAPLAATLAWYTYLISLAYLVASALVLAIMLGIAVGQNRLRARESRLEDFQTLRASPFTVPVSVIAPAFNEEVCVSAAVRSMLAFDYPEFEVIVVNDGSTDKTLACLRDDFELEPSGALYRRTLPSTDVRQIYRSRRHPNLVVIDKPNGGKADALNCGINMAQYRYLCCLDGDTLYTVDALLKGMRLINHDPARVLGVTSLMVTHRHPEREQLARQNGHQLIDRHPMAVFQMFDFLRSVVAARMAWSRGNYMLCAAGVFAIWRRDVVSDLGGFSKAFTCEDIEFTFRVHEHFRSKGTPYRILALPDPVAVTESPEGVSALVSQRARWQRVILETVWSYRRMLFNPRYGTVGAIGMPYYVFTEALAPVFQLVAIATIPLAVIGGVMGWPEMWRMVLIIAFAGALFTNASLLIQERNIRRFALRDLFYLVAITPLELLIYRPILFYAQFKGMFDFMKGDRGWHKFARNRRDITDAARS